MHLVNASEIAAGESYQISFVHPSDHIVRLMALGVRKGCQIELIRKTTGSGSLFKIDSHRVAMARSLAATVDVLPSAKEAR